MGLRIKLNFNTPAGNMLQGHAIRDKAAALYNERIVVHGERSPENRLPLNVPSLFFVIQSFVIIRCYNDQTTTALMCRDTAGSSTCRDEWIQ